MQRMKKRRAVAQFLFTLLVTPFFLLLLLFQSQFNYVSCHYILLLRNPCFLSQQGDHHFEIINSEIIFSFHQQQPSLLLFFVVLMHMCALDFGTNCIFSSLQTQGGSSCRVSFSSSFGFHSSSTDSIIFLVPAAEPQKQPFSSKCE